MWFSFLILAVTLSIDALGIGIAYAIKGVVIPVKAKLSIGIISSGILWVSQAAGEIMLKYLPEWCTKYLGVIILCVIGIVFIKNGIKQNDSGTYDLDSSKKIEGIETIFLAVSLSADSISIGMASAALGYAWFLLGITVGTVQMLFLYLGELIARRKMFYGKLNAGRSGIISGVMLIFIGMLRLCF